MTVASHVGGIDLDDVEVVVSELIDTVNITAKVMADPIRRFSLFESHG